MYTESIVEDFYNVPNKLRKHKTHKTHNNMKRVITNPWEMAYNHPNFEQYTRDDIDEMMLCEIEEILEYS
tara:strand:+ start:5287 stop:5496 length:210 start_codon:yes stop_codon:yes gene_type:complete